MHAIYLIIFIVFASAGSQMPIAVARQLISSYKIKPTMHQSDEFQSAFDGTDLTFETGPTNSPTSDSTASPSPLDHESTSKSRSAGTHTTHESSSPNPPNPTSSPSPTPKNETTTKLTSEGTDTTQNGNTQSVDLTTSPPTPSHESTTKSRSEGTTTVQERSTQHTSSTTFPPTPNHESTTKSRSEGTTTIQEGSTQHASPTTFPPTPSHQSTTKSRSEATTANEGSSTQPTTKTVSPSTPNKSTFESTTPVTHSTLKSSTKIATSESVTPTTAVTSEIVTLTSEEGSSTGTPEVVSTASEVNSSPVTTKFTESRSTTQTQSTKSETPKTESTKQTSVATESTKRTTLTTTSTAMPITTVVCHNIADDQSCDSYKKAGVCNYTSIRKVCELTCNPACQQTTAFMSTSTTSPGLIYTCKPGFVEGTYATHNRTGVKTCCDVIDGCDDLIKTANSTHDSEYSTHYDVCYNVTSGFFFSQCGFSCGGCAIENDTLSGLNDADCHDNFDTTKTCIPLLIQGYCSFLAARQNCWQTCYGCQADVPQSFETSGDESSAFRSPAERIWLRENTD